MATHKSAEKRNRQSIRQRERNKHRRSMVRNAVKRARQAMETRGSDASERVHEAERLLRRAASRGVLHKRTASRTVSRLYLALARVTA
jgi:small subunit ribosomal protein S20